MKRLGLSVFIAITFLIVGDIFSVPNKVMAASSFASAQQVVINAFTGEATFQAKYNDKQKIEYQNDLNSLKGILSMHAQNEDPSIGDLAFQIRSLDDFEKYLKGKMSVNTDTDITQVISDASNLARALGQQLSDNSLPQAYYNAVAGGGPTQVASQTQNASNAALQSAKTNGGTPPGQCSLVFPTNIGACISDFISFIIKTTLLNFAGIFLWIASSLLNVSIKVGILNFSDWAPSTLYALWIIVRQIVSLFVVFAGLYLGFMYIIGREDTFGKYIGWLALFALFVNFSYPLTRSIIDISNVISLNIYSSVVGTDPLTTDSVLGGNGAGSLIMNRISLDSLDSQVGANDDGVKGSVSGVPGSLLAVAYTFYAAYILFLAAGMMIFRTAVLVFLTIASPILFVDTVIPLLGEEAKKLRKIYLEQLFVAPVFMIMFALTMKFLEVFRNGDLTKAINSAGNPGIQSFFTIFLMLIMLHIMLKVTKSVGGSMTEFAMNGIKAIGGTTLGLAAGGAALAGRATLGRAGAALSESGWIKNNQDSFIGRRAYDLSNRAATSSFNVKNSNLIAGGLKKAGLDMGQGNKTGFNQSLQAKIEDRNTRYGRIEQLYKEDVYDANNQLIHKKGDINEEGKLAANRFSTTGGTVFDRKAVIKGVKEVQDKQNTTEEEAVNKVAQEKTQNYAKADKGRRDAVLQNLQSQLAEATKTDPNQEGTTTRGLVQALRDIQETKDKEYDSLQKEVTKSLEKLKNMDENKAALFKADLSDEVRAGVEAGGMAPRANSGSKMMSRNRPAPVSTPQVPSSNPTMTTNGSMPVTQSAPLNNPVTAASPNTTVINQTQAPVTPNVVPAYQRNGGADPLAPQEREMNQSEIKDMQQRFEASRARPINVRTESFAQRRKDRSGDDMSEGSTVTPPQNPPSLSPSQQAQLSEETSA